MITHDRSPSPDDARLDRLVEDDLPEAERRALLLSLDLEPDGWRRCALAFLEAQAWRESLGVLAHELRDPREGRPSPATVHRPAQSLRSLAHAAAVLGAFGLGWAVYRASPPSAPIVADHQPGVQPRPSPDDAPPTPEPEAPWPEVAEAPPKPEPDRPGLASARPAAPRPPLLPDFVRGQLERQGYRVERARGVLMGIRGGRRVAVPVDRVQIRYVGRRTS